MNKEEALIESRTLRNTYIDRTEVLEKVKKLRLLPDDVNGSVELVSEFYEVGKKTLEAALQDNREELALDGVRVLVSDELTYLKQMGVIGKNASSFTIIPRRAILRIGMLLRDSIVAHGVRDMLLDNESKSPLKKSSRTDDDKRLEREIRLKNARVREANVLLKVAGLETTEVTYKRILTAKAVEVVAGERLLPMPTVERATYTAAQVAEKLNLSSANAVGKLANRIGLKPPEGETNDFGEWVHTKSQYSVKQVKQFMYTDAGIERMRQAIQNGE